jgi:hypothetical protein
MERKEVAIENPVAVAGVTLIPVTRVSLNCQRGGYGISFFGVKQPISVVVASPSAKRAFRISRWINSYKKSPV